MLTSMNYIPAQLQNSTATTDCVKLLFLLQVSSYVQPPPPEVYEPLKIPHQPSTPRIIP